MNILNIESILELLSKQYGSPQFQPNHTPLAELVQTILSQNTSDHNSHPAYQALISAFDNWEQLLNADIAQIVEPISGGGLGQIKAYRIQEALKEIKRRCGKLDLNFLSNMPVPEARDWLKKLPGVGNKTANCVLLFSFGKPALPVDTHIFRVSKRLGLIDGKSSLDEAHRLLEELIPPDYMYEFHVLMIAHGRRICIAQRPRCHQCVLRDICPGYKQYTKSSPED